MQAKLFRLPSHIPSIALPLRIHTIFWAVTLSLLAIIIYLAETGFFGRVGIFTALIYVVITSLVAMLLMTMVSSHQQEIIAEKLSLKKPTGRNRGPLSTLFEDMYFAWHTTFLSKIERLWKLHTEDPIKRIVKAHVRIYSQSLNKANEEVNNKLAYWLYVSGTEIGFPKMLQFTNVLMYAIVFAVGVATWFFWQNSGMVVLTIIMSLMSTRAFYHSRLLYYHDVHATLLTACMHPVFFNQASTQPIYVHDGLAAKQGEIIKLFEKPVEWLAFPDLSNYIARLNSDTGLRSMPVREQPSQDTQKVRAYIQRHIDEGYPVDTLRKALVDAGNSPGSVDQWIADATGKAFSTMQPVSTNDVNF